jgi:nucleoside-diphosphate-sugar epimerase
MTEVELETLLSDPTPELVTSFAQIDGDILILGVGGKMGPSLARLAARASREAGVSRRVIGASRFGEPLSRRSLERDGIETTSCDLFDGAAVARLPDAPNVIYMAGRKFGTSGDRAATWATNAYLPGVVADRFAGSRIVAFSTGNVYPLSSVDGNGLTETDPVGPIGEYAQAALARERVFEFFSRRNHTPMVILRLNYAAEPRYGVLRDIAEKVFRGEPVDVAMGYANVIWQRDANAIALRALQHCASPPLVLNVTGRPAQSVRELAAEFGRRFGRAPLVENTEAATALLSDAGRSEALFGPAPTGISQMLDYVAEWVASGGRSLNLPTHFEEREGRF